jgi:hypothetical protein
MHLRWFAFHHEQNLHGITGRFQRAHPACQGAVTRPINARRQRPCGPVRPPICGGGRAGRPYHTYEPISTYLQTLTCLSAMYASEHLYLPAQKSQGRVRRIVVAAVRPITQTALSHAAGRTSPGGMRWLARITESVARNSPVHSWQG